MKCVKKLVAVLLIAVMALTLLTACGGGGSSAETGNQLTAKINNQLADDNSDIRLTYSDKLSSQAIVCLQYYQRTGDANSALQMANLNERDYNFIAIDVIKGSRWSMRQAFWQFRLKRWEITGEKQSRLDTLKQNC